MDRRHFAVLFLVAATLAQAPQVRAQALELSSSDIDAAEPLGAAFVFNSMGCTGGNRSPQLAWHGIPDGTKSLALTMFDPDVPGGGFWHWVVVDLPASATSLPRDAGAVDGHGLPSGARQLPNDFGARAWGGPCPPAGDAPHHYVFTLYALKSGSLGLGANASAAAAASAADKNALAKATLTARYGR
jgi:Raf kinase inhibitor-like YbhB/YbcL family protein